MLGHIGKEAHALRKDRSVAKLLPASWEPFADQGRITAMSQYGDRRRRKFNDVNAGVRTLCILA
jgi:hypothetical protein